MGSRAGRRPRPQAPRARAGAVWTAAPAAVRPMLATAGGASLRAADLVYEPKYDGIRVLADVDSDAVTLRSRNGNDKTAQFRDVVAALARAGTALRRPLLIDGELVALDAAGEPASFLDLQPRMHARRPPDVPVAFIAFDLLRDGDEDLRPEPLATRRARLETVLDGHLDATLRISEQVAGRGDALWTRAAAHGWEGLIAKQRASGYAAGRRSTAWRKLKLVRHQTCVVGGWTPPKGTRARFGALLLGVWDAPGVLRYIGDVGSGFTGAELEGVWARLARGRAAASPFAAGPAPPASAHWARPAFAVEVKFTEWTREGRLRHPTYLGTRNDVRLGGVRTEPDATAPPSDADDLLGQLDAIEQGRDSGTLVLPGGGRLPVSHLRKVFWPQGRLTKGDLFRHYVRVAPALLPVLADRPLVMRRHPNGVDGKSFYQHRAPEPAPAGVRVDTPDDDTDRRPHLIGGSLATLLYCTQLAAISQDPWLSRLGTEGCPDHVALDLDPPDGLPFARVLNVARWIRDELDRLGVPGLPKTSGAGGLHVYIPMPAGTSYESGQLFCRIIATLIASRHPKAATVERKVAARGQRVYVDFLQNHPGKTLASAYSARATAFAGVSTPLTWEEVEAGVRPEDFTVRTFAARLDTAGDLWAGLRESPPANLRAVLEKMGSGVI